tara:strand:- start:20 stop:598 length:579 start_codon:yes stop_codon:yes gene_type:complete
MSITITFIIVNKTSSEILFISIIGGASLYLLLTTLRELFKKKYNISQVISHSGFALFVLSILFNSLFSSEISSNMKIGEELIHNKEQIKFLKVSTFEKKNYKSIIANFKITDEKSNTIFLFPEIRIYNQPNILTSEADIKSNIFYDKFIVVNLLKGNEIFNIRYQTKPFMIWIWISVCLVSLGGMLNLIKRY